MKSIFLEHIYAGYEIMALAHRNHWRLIRCQTTRKGTRVLYMES